RLTDHVESMLANQIGDLIESLRVPRNDREAHTAMFGEQRAILIQNDLFLPGTGRSTHPREFILRVKPERSCELGIAVHVIGNVRGVKLHRAGDPHTLTPRAQFDEPPRIRLILHTNAADAPHHATRDRLDPHVLPEAWLGDAAI